LIRASTLSSGSAGNSILVDIDDTCILLDAGLPIKTLKSRLKGVAYSIDDIKHVFFSHDHQDHYRDDTNNALGLDGYSADKENFKISFFKLHHDAPCRGYRVEDQTGNVLVYITDTGHMPADTYRFLRGANIIILEFNHEVDMLEKCEYSSDLKERIAENHLSNEQAHDLIASTGSDNLKHLFCHHLSSKNNTPETVEFAARSALHECGSSAEVIVCNQDKPSRVVTVI